MRQGMNLKDGDGNVYLEKDNPVQVWTPEEWQAFLSEVEAEIQMLQQNLLSLPGRKARPDAETLSFWNAMHGSYADELQARIEARIALLEELKKV